jgi:hypothetical protein
MRPALGVAKCVPMISTAAAFQDILKRKRCSSDLPGFIALFCGLRRALAVPSENLIRHRIAPPHANFRMEL